MNTLIIDKTTVQYGLDLFLPSHCQEKRLTGISNSKIYGTTENLPEKRETA